MLCASNTMPCSTGSSPPDPPISCRNERSIFNEFAGGIEEKNVEKAAGKSGGIAPYSLRLLIYRPK